MDMAELFKGVAVVIDDEINNENANIKNILGQIESMNIPYLTYEAIPPEGSVAHFQNLSFLLLDWKLIKEETSDDIHSGVRVPSTLENYHVEEKIEFLKMLKNICFCPVFIFSNEDKNKIIDKLVDGGIYSKDKPNHIFVKSKSELTGKVKLFKEIEKWIVRNPSVYALKEWEREYRQSKNKLFLDFQELSPVWPKIMWKNFGDDGVNKSLELGELISRNLYTRMAPFEFSEEVLSKQGNRIDKDELRRVLEGERFLKNCSLRNGEISSGDVFYNEEISTGDVFKKKSNYYLNIRAACDCIPDRSKNNSTVDDVHLYLLKGSKLSDTKTKKAFQKDYGHFSEIDSQAIVFPIDDGKAIDFRFKKLEIETWGEMKKMRIGRILSPYINRIQQRYALYLQRQGLPRTPRHAVYGS